MRTGTRRVQSWMVGAAAVVGLSTLAAMEMASDGIHLSAGVMHVSMDVRSEQGISLTFQKRQAHGPARQLRIAETESNHQGS